MNNDGPPPSRYELAKQHLLNDNHSIIGRDDLIQSIKSLLIKSIENIDNIDVKKFIFIAGSPGTGKTASVIHILNQLKEKMTINYHILNGMKMNQPKMAFNNLLYQIRSLNEPSLLSSSNQNSKLLIKPKASLEKHFKYHVKVPTILLIDEIELLLTQNQYVVKTFIEWSLIKKSKLLLIGIANMADFPENLVEDITSQVEIERIIFNSYKPSEIKNIIIHRLGEYKDLFENERVFDFISKKVDKGDIRLSLEICRRSISMAEKENNRKTEKDDDTIEITKVNQRHVLKSFELMKENPQTIHLLNSISIYEKLLILSILICVYRNRLTMNEKYNINLLEDVSKLIFVLIEFKDLCRQTKNQILKRDKIDMLLDNLYQMNIIDYDKDDCTIDKKIFLNMEIDDIIDTLESDEVCNIIIKEKIRILMQ